MNRHGGLSGYLKPAAAAENPSILPKKVCFSLTARWVLWFVHVKQELLLMPRKVKRGLEPRSKAVLHLVYATAKPEVGASFRVGQYSKARRA